MIDVDVSPALYGLPHTEFRPKQESAINWCLDLASPSIGIIEAPTGSGKTALARACSSRYPTIALCRTKNLQIENYANMYKFDWLTGRSNWKCVHDMNTGAMADECLHSSNMSKCDFSQDCPYMVQKDICRRSDTVSLNYAYWLTAHWPRESKPRYLFLDEAHQLSEMVIGFAGTTITRKMQSDWQLPPFPKLDGKPVNKLLSSKKSDPVPTALSWLHNALAIMRSEFANLQRDFKHRLQSGTLDERTKKRFRYCEDVGRKIGNTVAALSETPDDWYIKAGPRTRQYRGRWESALIVKPLTAKHHFGRYFVDNLHNVVLMSATIGDFPSFADELGIDEYQPHIVPNQFDADTRPVQILDSPSMGAKKRNETDREFQLRFEKQADVIAESIKSVNSDWSGFVHVSRKSEAKLLADRLARRGLQDRVWCPPGYNGDYTPTDVQMLAWQSRKLRRSNSIGVVWSFWEGVDGLDEKICIAAKCPFPVFGSNNSYEEMWRKYSMRRYHWQTANTLAQGLGRTRRGRQQDYDIDDVRGLVAVADGSWNRIKKYLPKDLQDAIVN